MVPPEVGSTIPVVSEEERPDITYGDVGLDVQKQEIRETVDISLLV